MRTRITFWAVVFDVFCLISTHSNLIACHIHSRVEQEYVVNFLRMFSSEAISGV